MAKNESLVKKKTKKNTQKQVWEGNSSMDELCLELAAEIKH